MATAGALLVAAGATTGYQEAHLPSDPARTGGSTAERPTTVTAPPVAASAEGTPRRVTVPALGVSARVVPIHALGRTLTPPADPHLLGWWADGAEPGAAEGSALVTGHTVHTGGGVFDNLEGLHPHDRVVVRTDHDTLRYVVRRVRIYGKGSLARHAKSVFSQHVRGRLVLVTCENWNGERYLSNVVVTASLRN